MKYHIYLIYESTRYPTFRNEGVIYIISTGLKCYEGQIPLNVNCYADDIQLYRSQMKPISLTSGMCSGIKTLTDLQFPATKLRQTHWSTSLETLNGKQ